MLLASQAVVKQGSVCNIDKDVKLPHHIFGILLESILGILLYSEDEAQAKPITQSELVGSTVLGESQTYWAIPSSSFLSCSSSDFPLVPFFSCSMSRMIFDRCFFASLNRRVVS